MKEIVLRYQSLPFGLSSMEANPIILKLLAARGIIDKRSAESFLNPRYALLTKAEDIPGLKEVSGFISRAIEDGKKIGIYGDYDVDGITASTILRKVIESLGGHAHIMIPNRFDEGYGISTEGIDRFLEMGITKVVSVDCGITSVEEVKYAFSRGMDLVITDHHTPGETLPDTLILNPKLSDMKEIKELSGAGIALFVALHLIGGINDLLKELFFFGALGTIADVVPLTYDNRIIATLGLDALNSISIPGVSELLEKAGVKPPYDSHHLSFGLAPRLNAAGRMEDASKAVELFFSADPKASAAELDDLNTQRREFQESLVKKAVSMAGSSDEPVLLLASKEFNRGVNGIIASRIVERFNRPAIIFEEDEDGILHGSGRSISGVDLYALLNGLDVDYLSFGGHVMACGLRIKAVDLTDLRKKVTLRFREHHPDGVRERVIADMELQLSEFTQSLEKELARFKPFGVGNPAPRFLFKGVRVKDTRLVKERYRFYDCFHGDISFQLQDWRNTTDFGKNTTLDIIGAPYWNEFRGRYYLKVKYIDHL